jgi:hypothetical protein
MLACSQPFNVTPVQVVAEFTEQFNDWGGKSASLTVRVQDVPDASLTLSGQSTVIEGFWFSSTIVIVLRETAYPLTTSATQLPGPADSPCAGAV